MYGYEGILFAAILVAFLAGVFALIYKGSRPPQPVSESPTPPRKAVIACLIPVLCVVIGVVAPWCIGIYSAYRAARTANKALRAIGSMEVLLFLIAAAVPLLVR